MLEPLKAADIQEKVDLNLKKGMTLREIKHSLLEEKHMIERSLIRTQIQIQNLKEQIEYLEHLLYLESTVIEETKADLNGAENGS